MDLTDSPAAAAYRTEVRQFVRRHVPEGWAGLGGLDSTAREEFLPGWRKLLHEHGHLAVHWPAEVGGAGRTPEEAAILVEELGRAGLPYLPHPTDPFGIDLLGNTMLHWGTEEQRGRFLPRVLSGEDRWCQGYSEPEAGSDLAHVRTSAELRDGTWVINGQKIWVTVAHLANWIFLLTRTNREAPPHRGLSLLLVPLDQPGVEVRPIRMANGETEFNEVFLTDARTDEANVVGGVDNGWTVAMTLLGFERGSTATYLATSSRVELDRLVTLARQRGLLSDPLIRQRLAWCHTRVETQRYFAMKTITAMNAGEPPGAESSLIKIFGSEYHKVVTELAMDILGADAAAPTGSPVTSPLAAEPLGSPNSSAAWATVFLSARASTIYAGSSQIQRNIIGERVLGLPREGAGARAEGK
ncbi:acyl-CoA dehydrogenase [Prauserella coralliicola]|nr:acyl-CoA dehydrogenase [Prauserella coralliicola]